MTGDRQVCPTQDTSLPAYTEMPPLSIDGLGCPRCVDQDHRRTVSVCLASWGLGMSDATFIVTNKVAGLRNVPAVLRGLETMR